MEERKNWKKAEIIILVLLGIIGFAAVVSLIRELFEYSEGTVTYELLQEYVHLPEQEATPPSGTGDGAQAVVQGTGAAPEEASGDSGKVYYGSCPQVNFDILRIQNNDVVGWIYGPGTSINYPVVQGEDNDYYLTHMFDGEENKCGSIFMDCLNEEDLSNRNTFIHGHHMRNGTMFASLPKYSSQSYYDTHPVLWFVTPGQSYQVELFTGFVTDTESDAWRISFATEEDYQNWIEQMIASGAFKSDVRPGVDDRILSLATCSYEVDNARFVVMGILREVE